MELRPGTVADAEAVAVVHIRAWQAGYAGLLPQAFLQSLDESLDRRVDSWRRTAVRPDVVYLVALDDEGSLVGFTSGGEPANDEGDALGEIYTIYLDPDSWGTGVAMPLLGDAEQGLRDLGYRSAILWVLDANARARRFYEKAGWSADGGAKIEVWGEISLSEVRYRRPL
ncbi:MAG: GNAT family N-acetyltransferase [Acidimicrobiia bacterium]|nr:GNAT family N-acetyltransferase [Acidimicrobiia bacterium]